MKVMMDCDDSGQLVCLTLFTLGRPLSVKILSLTSRRGRVPGGGGGD